VGFEDTVTVAAAAQALGFQDVSSRMLCGYAVQSHVFASTPCRELLQCGMTSRLLHPELRASLLVGVVSGICSCIRQLHVLLITGECWEQCVMRVCALVRSDCDGGQLQ
jgi:hypothetical protein